MQLVTKINLTEGEILGSVRELKCGKITGEQEIGGKLQKVNITCKEFMSNYNILHILKISYIQFLKTKNS